MVQSHSRAFHTLDGLRGIAALLIIPRHLWLLAGGISLPESYLAVDLFFLLSGFVIAYAYDNRLARPGFLVPFLQIRLIRLYPLYLLGLAAGFVYRTGSVLSGTDNWTASRLLEAFLLGLLLVPQTPWTAVGSSDLDNPTWTLFPELVANMLYAVLFRWLTKPVLLCICIAGGFGVIGSRITYGTLDGGWDLGQFPLIASRLAFSFFGGVLVFRLLGDRRRIRPAVSWLCVLSTGAALSASPSENWRLFYELALVLVVFPLVVWVACQSEPGPVTARLFRFMGLVSYAVYVLHQPVGALFEKFLARGLHLDLEATPVTNSPLLAFVVTLVLGSWLVDRYYDRPVRRTLTNWAKQSRSA